MTASTDQTTTVAPTVQQIQTDRITQVSILRLIYQQFVIKLTIVASREILGSTFNRKTCSF